MRSTVLRHSKPPPDYDFSENLESLADLRAQLHTSVESLHRTIRQTEQLLAELMVSASQGPYRNGRK